MLPLTLPPTSVKLDAPEPVKAAMALMGLLQPVYTLAVQNVAPRQLMGAATSSPIFFRQIGSTVGVAAFGSIMLTRYHAVFERGLPVHLVNHLATMADLHRAGRYDRMSDDVLTLTGQAPMSVQEFVRKNVVAFTASAKAA